jgi:undecaprenyl diphosphate synthase
MDGNGRFAVARGLSRSSGHKEGMTAARRVIEACDKKGVKIVSFYAFSTENWKREKGEIDYLFDLLKDFIEENIVKEDKKNYQVNFMGNLIKLPKSVQNSIERAKNKCRNNTGLIINIGINYGARSEIVMAANRLIASGRMAAEEDFARGLYTAGLSDPDIIVRTAGEMRLSNFMLFQAAYSELLFLEKCWPEMNECDINFIIAEYNKRKRTFGGI